MGNFLTIRQLLVEKATDFMPVAMDLEEETLTTFPIVAIILAVGYSSVGAVWSSIHWIGIAYTVIAPVSQRYLAVWHRDEIVGSVTLVVICLWSW